MSARVAPSFTAVIAQILILDAVFSLDSVITAVGMVDDIAIYDRRGHYCHQHHDRVGRSH